MRRAEPEGCALLEPDQSSFSTWPSLKIRIAFATLLLALIALWGLPNSAFGSEGDHILSRGFEISQVTSGPDGNLWFIETEEVGRKNRIGRITPLGQTTEYPLPDPEANPADITAGPDGNLWFIVEEVGQEHTIGRITPSGQISQFTIPTTTTTPSTITAGPDGNLWFAGKGVIGRIATSGQITEYPRPNPTATATEIIVGLNGNLWFAGKGVIGQISSAGQITEYALPPAIAIPRELTAGPEGFLWFIGSEKEVQEGTIGRVSTSGQITEYPRHSKDGKPLGITIGPDGSLWFTIRTYREGKEILPEEAGGKIGRITPGGEITEYPLQGDEFPISIVTGPDGNLWFTADHEGARGPNGGTINRISLRGRVKKFNGGGAPRSIISGPGNNLWYTALTPRPGSLYGLIDNEIGRITPPAQETFTEIPGLLAPAHRRWAHLRLVCGGGAVGSACRGTLRLVGQLTRPAPHGRQTTKRFLIAQRHYSIAWESSRFIALRLTHRALSLIANEGGLSAEATATESGSKVTNQEVQIYQVRRRRRGKVSR